MSQKIRLFLDLNETLIHTGQISNSVFISEAEDLIAFRDKCNKLASTLTSLEIVFLTGNSFEYSRRIEEPLGIKNINNISFLIISENGLLARSFKYGNIWALEVTEDYKKSVAYFLVKMEESSIVYFTQGNEIRVTLKPTLNQFTKKEIEQIIEIAHECNIDKFSKIYTHKFYIDIDPKHHIENGNEVIFTGKHYATSRVIQADTSYKNIAIGDSKSDIPMFDAVVKTNGNAYWVSNSSDSKLYPNADVLNCEFTKGVNQVLNSLIKNV